ncbi:hypothetical protein [Streptomyces sp. BK239]|uniref:hypothetical protein n=1 Tax=Streptomyces sp. BK239 TaxID=2512155 RepID=UPI00102BF203|nr:hypothetical protein [Streptomyces sp. BK239]RZU21733.1 hypothetical protein EV567_2238 [Streptomyces sp. BK239]
MPDMDPPAQTGEQNPDPDNSNATTPPPPGPAAAAQQRETALTAERDELRAALDAVNKALNADAEQGEQDPAALAAAVADRDKQLGQAAADLRSARVELAAYKAAGEQGARADRLLNSRSFLAALAELDPDDVKFGERLGDAIKSAVEADPDLYRAGPSGPVRGGAEFNGAPTGERRAATLHDAVAARLSGA